MVTTFRARLITSLMTPIFNILSDNLKFSIFLIFGAFLANGLLSTQFSNPLPAMETPSSMRRVTRSQTASAAHKSEQEDHLSSRSRAKGKPERSPLLDVTNDSPIVGLATEKTPASSVAKSSVRVRWTPGSGEALLRGQVKTLLQKVEEEEAAELGGEILLSGCHRPPFLVPLGFLKSPLQLLAPTPANTPQIPNATGIAEECAPMGVMVVASAVQEQHSKILPQVVEALKHDDEPVDDSGCPITRALLFDSPEKSEASDTTTVSSSLTYQGSESCHTLNSTEDDNSSTWSIQVNASTQEDDDEDIQGFEVEELNFNEEEQEEQGEEEDDDEQSFADLCEGLRRMTVEENGKKRLPEFAGKHTRFIYNSDDEMEGKEVFCENQSVSPSVLVLKGLPVPEGKHLRFQDEEEEN